jgi:replicative DNA helicase
MADFFEAEQQIMVNILHGHGTELLPTDLKDGPHQAIVEAAIALRNDGVVPDAVTVRHWIGKHIGEENFGDMGYIQDLSNKHPNVKRQEVYESIVKEQALRQKVIAHANALLHEAEDGTKTEDLVIMAQKEPLKLGGGTKEDYTSLAQDVAYDVLEEVQQRRRSNRITGLETPFKELNKITNGLQDKDLIIIAGRPSMGKTALASQLATHVAKVEGPVFVGSLEMDRSSLVERQLVGAAQLDGSKVRSGHITDGEYEQLQVAAERMQDFYPIVINDSSRVSAQELRMEISKANLKYNGLSLAVIDYLGLLKEDKTKRGRQRYQEIGEATKLMRTTAKELGIPVILVCQLNRECEYRENKRPTLADLKESGEIEQDSDVIMMLYRDEYYCKKCGDPGVECDAEHEGVAEIIVRKQRNGPTGIVMLTWQAKHTQFYNFEKGSSYDDIAHYSDTESPRIPPTTREEPKDKGPIPF